MDIHNSIKDIHNSITDIHNSIMDIHNYMLAIMDIHNIHNYGMRFWLSICKIYHNAFAVVSFC